jgi:hypothetical protein
MAGGAPRRPARFRTYADLVRHFEERYPRQFDDSELWPQFRTWVGYDGRIEVSGEHRAGQRRTGYLGVTSGWRPAFILVARSDSMGSSDVLRKDDEVIARQRADGKYHPISTHDAVRTGPGLQRRRQRRSRRG